MRNILTKEILNAMIDDYHNGASLIELSEKYGFQNQTIQRHFNKNGLHISKGNTRKFSKEELDAIIEDYNNGMRPYELGKKYNRTSSTIIDKLKSIGIYKCVNYRFTKEDIDFLKIHYPNGDWNLIKERFPHMNKQRIVAKMSELGIKAEYFKDKKWTDENLIILKDNYYNGNLDNILKLLPNRTYKAITTKAKRIGVKTRDFWSENELEALKKHYKILEIDELLNFLPNRSKECIYIKASDLGLHREQNFYKDYEINFVKNNALVLSDEEIASVLNRSVKSIQAKRLELGFSKFDRIKGYSTLSEYIRGHIFKWKMDSLKKCNYKCVLTGESFDCIHHIHGFNLIFNEMIKDYNLEIKEDISLYTNEELDFMLKCFNALQNKYPLGVCLRKDLHILFHSLYGYGNNTEEQWDEFSNNYKNGNYKVA